MAKDKSANPSPEEAETNQIDENIEQDGTETSAEAEQVDEVFEEDDRQQR